MASYNRVILMGNLTRDPDYKQLPSGQSVCRLSIASNRQFKNRQTNELVQEVCYMEVEVWGAQAESCNQYLQKGRPVLIEGRIKLETWTDQNGQTRNKHIIVADRVLFLPSARGDVAVEDTSGQKIAGEGLEKGLLDQIGEIKSRASKPAATAGRTAPNKTILDEKADFKDTPPFQDELPF